PWLHAAAYRIACKARSARCARTAPAGADLAGVPAPAADPAAPLLWDEVRRALDEELDRLPQRLREPLVLCYLQGHTRDEAARLLGWTLATLKRRLERGRSLLRERLSRRGLSLAGAGAGLALTEPAVPVAEASAAARAAVEYLITSAAPPAAAALLKGAVMSRSASRWLAVLSLAVLGLGTGLSAWAVLQPDNAPTDRPREASKPAPEAADAAGDPLPAGAVARLGSTRLRPGARITHLAFSPDGKRLASWGNYLYHHDRLSVWDTATGKELRTAVTGENRFAALNWGPDGRGFVVLVRPSRHSVRTDFEVWEFTDEKAPPPSPPPPPGPGAVRGRPGGQTPQETFGHFAISPEGKLLAGAGTNGEDGEPVIKLWELKACKSVKDLLLSKTIGPVPPICTGLVFPSDGGSLLVFGREKDAVLEEILEVWDVKTGKRRRAFPVPMATHQDQRKAFAVSPDGKTLAFGLKDGTARLIDLTTGRERLKVAHVTPGKDAVRTACSAVGFTRDGKALITGGRDNAVKVWDAATGRKLADLDGHHSWPEAVGISPDGRLAATSGQDSLIRLWDAKTWDPVCPPEGHQHTIWGLDVSPDGKTVLTMGWDGTSRLWDLNTGKERLRIGQAPFAAAYFTPDGRAVIGGSIVSGENNRPTLWDAATGKELPLPGELAEANGRVFGFSPDGRTLLTSSGNTLTLWDWPAGRKRHDLRPAGEVHGVALSPDGRTLVTHAGQGTVVEVWDARTGVNRKRLNVRGGMYRRLTAFTRDGRSFLLMADDHVSVWDVATLTGLRRFESSRGDVGQHYYVIAIGLSPDGRALAVAGSDGAAVLYEVATGQIRRRLTGHRESVSSVAFTPDGKRLITGSLDHSALVWDVSLATIAPENSGKPTAEDLTRLWDELAGEKTEVAFPAQARLAAAPETAVGLLRQKLRPVSGEPDAATLDRIFKGLASERFAVREKAAAELEKLGEVAAPAVRRRLEKVESEEARRRAEQFLQKYEKTELTPERLRQTRALEVLEQVGGDEARALLEELAKGSAGAWLTEEAKAALGRRR
ncbi:MAG TPA: sigma factor-like helix-turn-helix DNA-binding protein, partial [Gemmataceae bacterium]